MNAITVYAILMKKISEITGDISPVPDIQIGTVSQLPAGSMPTVTRREGSPDETPVFDFGIPAGADNVYVGKDPVPEGVKVQVDPSGESISIPTDLKDLNEDELHRIVTDTEKNVWNSYGETIQSLEDGKADYKIKVIGTDSVSQMDAREVLSFPEQYEGKLIEFLTNGENPSKCVATGRTMTTAQGDTYLITYNKDGTTTVWSKDSYEKHLIESTNLINAGLVDIDNLTIDNPGDPPHIYFVRKAMNDPSCSDGDGVVFVLPHAIDRQIQYYVDMITGKQWYRLVKGTSGRHSFGSWSKNGKPLVELITSENVALVDDTIYRATSLNSLSFSLPSNLDINSTFDTEVDITIGATPMQVIAPSGIDWMGDDVESGAWVPKKDLRYVLYVYWDGVRFRAISQSQKAKV